MGYYVEVLREFRKRFRRKRPVAFPPGQCTSPQLHPCLRLFNQNGHQDCSSPSYSLDLVPVTFGYSLSSEAVVLSQLRRWKRLWRRSLTRSHWHTRKRGLPWGLPEVIGTVQQMHCGRRRLLRRGLEFHVSTLNKSAHTKKSMQTYLMILIYIYIYIYIYWQHFFINRYFVEHNRYFLSTYFFVDPFILPYWLYYIRRELVDKYSIIIYFPSTFFPTLDNHQRSIYYKMM